jgi:helicase
MTSTSSPFLTDANLAGAVSFARTGYLLSQIVSENPRSNSSASFRVPLLAGALENAALVADPGAEAKRELFQRAFILRRRAEVPSEPSGRLIHIVRLAADGILSQRSAEVLMQLRKLELPSFEDLQSEETDFIDRLFIRVARSFVLLVRRSEGWSDLRMASEEIKQLRAEHSRIAQTVDDAVSQDSTESAVRLISGFNLAKIVDITSNFTTSGSPANALMQVERHAANRDMLGKYGIPHELEEMGDLIQAACHQLVRSSIWSGTAQLGADLRRFVSHLANPAHGEPMLELWPSQREALESHLLDPAHRAVVVEMPTSAGKTLLAEFSIIQARALNPQGTVAYVVPTRALVNQITQRLRRDLSMLGLTVEASIPVADLDPTESLMLEDRIDVLVCTPEKLSLLIKDSHSSVRSLSLAVIDEAHNIGDGDRGVKLDLLLGTLKREKPETRFLLLTPFVPNANQLSRWLGDMTEATISLDWRPSERVAVTAHWKKPKQEQHQLILTTLSSSGNVDVPEGETVVILKSDSEPAKSKSAVSSRLAEELSKKGGVLILTRGRGTAEKRAQEIASFRSKKVNISPLLAAVRNFAELELGQGHPLPSMLERGVAFHHAGLSHDLRYLLERLIDDGDVNIIAGTTTLAQGLNFPISSVIVETLSKPYGDSSKQLTYSEFWNIAGRAGRAMRDPLGLVAFPCAGKRDRDTAATFLNREASEVASALLEAVRGLDDISDDFNLHFTRDNRTLSVFLEYLTHVTKIAGVSGAQSDLEDILRSSLAYQQLLDHHRESAPILVSLARKYINSMSGDDRGILALADGTGFSLATAKYLLAKGRFENRDFQSASFWEQDNLFSTDLRSLTRVIDVLEGVPELDLSPSDLPGVLDTGRVAGIIRDWVSGMNVTQIGDRWFDFVDGSNADRTRSASHYIHTKLVGQVPWGIGALQRMSLFQPRGTVL